MTDLLLLLATALAAAAAAEKVKGGRKVQAAPVRMLLVFLPAWAATAILLPLRGGPGTAVCTLFWAGAFLSWFGVRSHLESSILLRMIAALRENPLAGEDLLRRYEARYGIDARREELTRAGLTDGAGRGCRLTARGRRVLGLVKILR